MTAVLAARNAVLAKLKADMPTVDGHTVGIYEHPPQDMAMPAITIDRVFDEPDDLLAEQVSRVTVTLTLWSTARGPRQAETIRGHVRAILHDASLTLTSGASVMCRYQRGDVTRDGDGVTYMGSVLVGLVIEH